MGMDLSYETSKLLTEEEKNALLRGDLVFENGYSLNLISKEDAEKIKIEALWNFLIDNITIEELKENIENVYDDLENYLLEQYEDRDDLPMSFEEKLDRSCNFDGYNILKIEEYNYNNKKLYIVIDVRYW